ncbi:c terminal region domain-containing protein, partial [Cystoisospora suis]
MSLNTMATVQRASFLAVSKLPSSSSSSLLPSSSSSSSGLSSYVSFSRHKGMNRNLLSKTKRLLSFSSSSSLVNRNPYITTTPVDCLATPLSKESKDLSPSSSASQDHKLSNSGLLLSSSSSSPSRHNSTYLSRQSLHTLSLLKRTSGEEETHYSHLHAKFTRKARIRRTLHPSFFFTSLPSVRSRPTPCTPLLSSSSSLSSSFPNLTTPASQTKHVSYYSVSQKAFFSTSRGNTRGGGEGDSSEKTTNPYAILGCSPSSTPQEIKKKFRELAKKYHPDLNPDPAAKQKMAEVAAAYELLSDPKQREFYDKTGMTPEQAAAAAAAAGGAGGGPHPGAGHGPGGFDASFMFTDFAEMFANMAGFGSATGGMGGSFTSTTFTSGGAESGTAAVRGDDIQTEVTIELLEAIQGCEKTLRFSAKCSCPSCSGTGSSTGSSGIQRCRACGGSGVQRIDRGPIVLGIPCRQCNGGGQVITHPC